MWMWPLGVILGPIALFLGIRAMRSKRPRRGRGLAIAGISTGSVGLALSALLVTLIAIAIVSAPSLDRGEEVRSVQATPGSRNLDADAAREFVVQVHAWGDASRPLPVRAAGDLTVRIERQDAQGWVTVAQEALRMEPSRSRLVSASDVAFPAVELDPQATYRIHARLVVDATGLAFEDRSPPWLGADIPDA